MFEFSRQNDEKLQWDIFEKFLNTVREVCLLCIEPDTP